MSFSSDLESFMDDDALKMRNWGYYVPSFKGDLGLQLMTSMAEWDTKPYIPGRDPDLMVTTGAAFHPRDCIVSEGPIPMHYVRDTWISQRKPPLPDPSTGDGRVVGRIEDPLLPKKSMDIKINGYDMDISGIPVPVCSCTGTTQQCYRWGCGGWQSACCTTNVSMYPLPMSTKRRGARIAGRKMSRGAFKKVLEKLAAEKYNFSEPINLRSHWARHGTNKFVTIR
ncbi:Barley B recombinant-like protein A [Hibiscus syriacus]|uniref:GAGA-binding transcriptional activator n=1 Tax=Hibiscus syriacus TaxID=106335 RepID=A0A6A3BJ17_HIBSY|nr:Barley B recombinant-like protein A [Hibiscus syriacus]